MHFSSSFIVLRLMPSAGLLHGADSPKIKAPDIPQTASKVSQSQICKPIDKRSHRCRPQHGEMQLVIGGQPAKSVAGLHRAVFGRWQRGPLRRFDGNIVPGPRKYMFPVPSHKTFCGGNMVAKEQIITEGPDVHSFAAGKSDAIAISALYGRSHYVVGSPCGLCANPPTS
jgi:hypothetical protein